MKNRVVPLRIPENLDDLAASSAREQHSDKAATLRQWIHLGAVQYVLGLVAQGRLSIGRAAELLDESVYDLYRIAETGQIELGATDEQRKQSSGTAARLSGSTTSESQGG